MTTPLQHQFEQYISYCINTKGLSAKTIKSYRNIFGHFSKLMPEIRTVSELTPEALDNFFLRLRHQPKRIGTRLVKDPLKASTLRTYGTKLFVFFNWLCERGALQVNPINKKRLPVADYDDHKALTKNEVERIFGAVTQQSYNGFLFKREMAMLHVLLFGGLRKNELLSLRVMDVDLINRTLRISGATSKSKRSRKIPLTSATVMHLEEYIAKRRIGGVTCEQLWVSYRGMPLSEHGLLHWVKKMRAASGVRFHLHQFRHTFTCMLGRGNVSAVKAQNLLGHRSLQMTQTYMRSLGVDDVRDSIQALSLDRL